MIGHRGFMSRLVSFGPIAGTLMMVGFPAVMWMLIDRPFLVYIYGLMAYVIVVMGMFELPGYFADTGERRYGR